MAKIVFNIIVIVKKKYTYFNILLRIIGSC